jgi:hypothetical protein
LPDIAFVTAPGVHSFEQVGPFLPGQVITYSWTSVTVTTPCGQYGYAVNFGDSSGGFAAESRYALTQQASSREYQIGAISERIFFSVYTDTYCSGGTMHGFTASVSPPPPNCAYGTRLSSVGNTVLFLSVEVIQAALGRVGLGALGWLFSFAANTTIDMSVVCGTGPGELPDPTLDWFTSSVETKWRWFRAILWYSYCECIPGSPAPIPYPIPGLQPPANSPVPPTYTCNETDICATLVAIRQAVGALQTQMASTLELTTLLQRYELPFATIPGARHSGLTGTGSFLIPRCAGLELEVTAGAEGHQQLFGSPVYLWDMGWVAVLGPDGMTKEHRVTRFHEVWHPDDLQYATSFSYALSPGVVLAVRERYAEP